MSTTKNAICKFCGQIFCDIIMPDSATEQECLERGAQHCRCAQAVEYTYKKKQANKAKLELASITEENAENNIKGIDQSVVDLLESGIDRISEDKIHQIKVGLCSGGTIEIKCTSAGKITVVRSTTIKQKREVE